MLQAARMKKVRAICLKAAAPSVIKVLHNLSVLHIKDAIVPEVPRSGPLPSYDEIAARLVRLRSMKEAMGKAGSVPKKKLEIKNPLSEADGLLGEEGKLRALIAERDEFSRQAESALSSQKALADVAGLAIDFSSLQSESLQFVLLKAGAQKAMAAQAAISKRKNSALASAPASAGSVALLIALPKNEDAKFLEQFGQIMGMPQVSGTPAGEIRKLKASEKEARAKLSEANAKIGRFAEKNYPRLLALLEALEIEEDRAQVATQFASSEQLYFIEGWVEKGKCAHLESELKRKFGRKIAVSSLEPDLHHEMPPTKLDNPKAAGAFQFLVGFLSTPGYSEIDPTLLVMFFIPLLYALIFGDAGYAVLSFLLSSYFISITQKGGMMNQVSRIWRISAIPAFLAGIAFDEWFGFSHTALLAKFGFNGVQLYSALLHRVESVQTLMLLVIIVGAVQIGIGFILGAVNEWGHSKKHAIAKLSWLGIEIGGFFTVAIFMFNSFTFLSPAAPALLFLSIAALIATEGIIGAFEIPGLASNIMSYIRIAAVGVGGVILAEAINDLLFPHFDASPLGIAAFVLTAAIYLGMHAVSCIIAMFEAFIHGTRLQVVEFFGKFYKGNGKKFSPFSSTRVYSQEA